MVDVGKLINSRNLVVREVTWFFAPNYVRTIDFFPCKMNDVFGADHMTMINTAQYT